jgi:hypothetical protein
MRLGVRHGSEATLTPSDLELLVRLLGARGASNVNPLSPAGLQGNIIVDPQNSTLVATSTGNRTATVNGLTGPVFSTYRNVASAWGTVSPFINAATNLVWASPHLDNTDPVVWLPLVQGSVPISIQGGPPTVVASNVSLANTTAKNRTAGANSFLQENIGASGAVAQLVRNTTTGKISRSWVYRNVAGTTFIMTQPFVPLSVGGTFVPAQVNTWGNGDTVDLLNPIAINLVRFSPTFLDWTAGNASKAYVYQCRVLDPSGTPSTEAFYMGGGVRCYEVDVQRRVFGDMSPGTDSLGQIFANCSMRGQLTMAGTIVVIGGCVSNGGDLTDLFQTSIFDGDVIIGSPFGVGQAGLVFDGAPLFGLVGSEAGLQAQFGEPQFATSLYGSHVLYGVSGSLQIFGSTHAFFGGTATGAFTSASDIAGIQLNGATNAVSHTNAQPDVLNGNVTTSVSNIDAGAGVNGFGGKAQHYAGASISNEV